MTDKPIYKLKSKDGRYWIERPDGSRANDCDYEHKREAEIWLSRYIALGYCRGEDDG